MRSTLSLVIVLMGLVAAAPAGAAPSLPEPGTRIRLTARVPERHRWTGSFVSAASDTVTMRDGGTDGARVTAPALHVERFEISRGDRSNGVKGLGRGFAIGAVLGAGAAYLAYDTTKDYGEFSGGRTGHAVVGGVVLGATGAVVGTVVGLLVRSEHWRDLPPKKLRAETRP
jgi:hypothetical protein